MMTKWREEMATGDEEIDRQHKELLRHVDDLLQGARAARGGEEIGRLLWFLKKYVRQHFRAEEKLQHNSGFPGYGAHKTAHEAFFREVKRLEVMHAEKGACTVLIVATVISLSNWLRGHFHQMDMEMVRFLLEEGNRPEVTSD